MRRTKATTGTRTWPRPRALTAFAAAVTGLLVALLGGGTAQAAGPSYVALGDSYSSGNGAGDYIGDSGDCHRSNSAYPALWAAANAPSSFSFVACSGAVTSDVTGSQVSALSADTQLVSISIGGNDAGFADVMTSCVISSVDSCLADVDSAESFISGTLPGRLDATYDAIRANAPDAHVVVLGYPRMYIEPSPGCAGIGETKRAAINDAADLLNTVISGRAAAHGFAFGDVRNTFAGHELCSGDDWLHDLALPVWESYHPTAVGHSSGYLPVLNAND